MSNKRTLLSLAVAAGLGAVSLQANAAAPTIYGDLAVALVYLDSNASGGTSSSYNVNDNVSLLGVKGEVAKMGNTSYFYDFNFILNQCGTNDCGLPFTHLAMAGASGDFGTMTLGLRDNGLYGEMVDNGTYQQNWFYTPGMSAFQVSDAIKYVTKDMSGFKIGVQAFDIGKDNTGNSQTNYTVAGTYTTGPMTFGAGYTDYSEYSTGADNSQSGFGTNTILSGTVMVDKTKGVSFAYAGSNWNVTAAYDVRTPFTGDDLKQLMVTGAYSFGKSTVAANYSDASGLAKGAITTLIYSYAPTDALYYSVEYQASDADANASGLTYATGGTGSSSSVALGVTYNF